MIVIGWFGVALALDVSTESLVQGDSADLTATAATPGATVEFVRGVGGAQTVLGQAVADASGTATLAWSVPQAEPPGPGVLVAREGAVQSAPIAAPVYEVLRTSRTVRTQADVDALEWLVRIEDAFLGVDVDPGITSVEIPRLVLTGTSGDNEIMVWGGPDLVTVSLPRLRWVYDFGVGTTLPIRIEAPALEYVETLWMSGGEADLPSAVTIGTILALGSTHITLSGTTHARMLTTTSGASTVTVEGLRSAVAIGIEDTREVYLPDLVFAWSIGNEWWGPTPPLQVLDLPSLERVTHLALRGPTTTSLTFPALRQVFGTLGFDETDLVTISAPNLASVDRLSVTENADLQVLDLPSLVLGGEAVIHDNPLLPACDADAIASLFPILVDCYANAGSCGVCL